MKNRIKAHFKNKDNNILSLRPNDRYLYDWPKIRNPLRIFWNYSVIKLSKLMPLHTKVFMYRHLLGMKIGKRVSISPLVEFDYFYPELVEIDDHAIIGIETKILTHEFTHTCFKFGRVKIGKKSLVGAFAKIRAGVTIGDGATVAMSSLVHKDVPANEVWGGIPMRKIK